MDAEGRGGRQTVVAMTAQGLKDDLFLGGAEAGGHGRMVDRLVCFWA